MLFIFSPKFFFLKPIQLKYFAPKIWRIIFLIKTSLIYNKTKKYIWTRGSVIPLTFWLHEIIIYTGYKWLVRRVTFWHIGFKFGEFTVNRKYSFPKKKKK